LFTAAEHDYGSCMIEYGSMTVNETIMTLIVSK
jgi:hypothetical protein